MQTQKQTTLMQDFCFCTSAVYERNYFLRTKAETALEGEDFAVWVRTSFSSILMGRRGGIWPTAMSMKYSPSGRELTQIEFYS